MARTIVSEGKTTAEAVENGLKELKVSKDMVELKVIEDGEKRSFYSILTPRVVKVELTVKEGAVPRREASRQEHHGEHAEKRPSNQNMEELETASEAIKEFLDKFLKEGIKYEVKIENYEININISEENPGEGSHGKRQQYQPFNRIQRRNHKQSADNTFCNCK